MSRNPGLDAVRALAALAVLGYHVGVPGFGAMNRVGVDVFFVLSGYLITGILRRRIEAGTLNVGSFLAARLRRLVPALALMVGAVLIIAWAASPVAGRIVTTSALVSLLYLSDIDRVLGEHHDVFLGHTWTLAVEMQFYLAWPWALARVMRTRRPARVLWGLTGGFAALWAVSPSVWIDVNPAPLLAGAALAFTRVPSPPSLTAALAWPPLASLGLLSYGLYLWHPLILEALRGFDWPVRLAIALPLSTLLAALSYLTVERWAGCAREPLWPREPRLATA